METEDDTTWVSTSCRFVEELEGRWWYKKAQSLDVDEDRPYTVRGSGRDCNHIGGLGFGHKLGSQYSHWE